MVVVGVSATLLSAVKSWRTNRDLGCRRLVLLRNVCVYPAATTRCGLVAASTLHPVLLQNPTISHSHFPTSTSSSHKSSVHQVTSHTIPIRLISTLDKASRNY